MTISTPETLPDVGAPATAPRPRRRHHGAAGRRPRSSRRSRRAAGPRRRGSPTRSSPPTASAATASTSSACSASRTSHRRLYLTSRRSPASTPGRAVRSSTLALERDRLELPDDLELTDEEIEDIRRLIRAFEASPLHARVAAARKVTREAAFAFALEPDGSGPLVRGFVDVIAHEHDGTHLVVDYKTDRLPEDTTPAEYIARAYETQRLVYALAALRAGAETVEVAYCLLEQPDEPVTAIYRAADAPELADRLTALARGHRRSRLSGHGHAAPRAVRRLPRAARSSAATRRAGRLGLRRLLGREDRPVIALR